MENKISKSIKRWKYNLLIMNLHVIYNSTGKVNKWSWRITPKKKI